MFIVENLNKYSFLEIEILDLSRAIYVTYNVIPEYIYFKPYEYELLERQFRTLKMQTKIKIS